EANALSDKGDRLIAALAAAPAHDHHPARLRGALGNAEQRAHSQSLHSVDIEHFDADAELAQLAGAAGGFHTKKKGRRLIDKIARGDDALDDMRAGSESLSRRSHIAYCDRNIGAQRSPLAFLLL